MENVRMREGIYTRISRHDEMLLHRDSNVGFCAARLVGYSISFLSIATGSVTCSEGNRF